MADNQSRVSININVEVSEALTGLKAIQREAKKATQALKETELAELSTEDLVEELRRRTINGKDIVQYHNVRPRGKGLVQWEGGLNRCQKTIDGEAYIFVYEKGKRNV